MIITDLSPDCGLCQDDSWSPYSRSVIAASSLTTLSSPDFLLVMILFLLPSGVQEGLVYISSQTLTLTRLSGLAGLTLYKSKPRQPRGISHLFVISQDNLWSGHFWDCSVLCDEVVVVVVVVVYTLWWKEPHWRPAGHANAGAHSICGSAQTWSSFSLRRGDTGTVIGPLPSPHTR